MKYILYIILGSLILTFILFIFIIIFLIKLYRQRIEYKEEYIEEKKQQFDSALSEERHRLEMAQQARLNFDAESARRINLLNRQVSEQEQRAQNEAKVLKDQYQQLVEQNEKAKGTLDSILNQYYDSQMAEYTRSLRATENDLLEQAEEEFARTCASLNSDIDELRATLAEYQKKRDAINEEILRQRAVSEQQDFYRICLTDDDLEDINYLLSIIDRLRNKEILSKLIWSEYLQKPFKKMMNNVLGNSDPKNVIYKITNLKTQEIYIGKTSGLVSNRWTEHIKTSLNIGTIKRSNIHKALYQHWSDFSWEILEKVDSETKLGEREKFYVNFYQSTIYGYNIKSGG